MNIYALEIKDRGIWTIVQVDSGLRDISDAYRLHSEYEDFDFRVVKYSFADLAFLRTYATNFELTPPL